jgi:hypothetical protein
MYGTPEHTAWQGMIARCINPAHPSYKNYGGRGITVLPEWQGMGGFQKFFEHVGPRPKGQSLDRINPHGNYEPGNVRWATKDLQEANKRPVLDATEISNLYYCRKTGKFYRDVTNDLPQFIVDNLRAKYGVDATSKNGV